MFKFLVGQEFNSLKDEVTENNSDHAIQDVMRFLEVALDDAIQEPMLTPIPKPEEHYDNARIFHHYFSAYRDYLAMLEYPIPLHEVPNDQIVEFILDDFDKSPIPEPLTFEQTEKQAVQLGVTRFLTSPQGQNFLSSKTTRYITPSRKLKTQTSMRDHWTFLILYWRFRRQWKRLEPLESASVGEITDFLTTHYMNYWRTGIIVHDKPRNNNTAQVFSMFLDMGPTSKYSHKYTTCTDRQSQISLNSSGIITTLGDGKMTTNSPDQIRRIEQNITSASLEHSSTSNRSYSPKPRLSQALQHPYPLGAVQGERSTDSTLGVNLPETITGTAQMDIDPPSCDCNKENNPPHHPFSACPRIQVYEENREHTADT